MRRKQIHHKWLLTLVAALGVQVACVPRYKPPTAEQPHAIAKLRRTYENTSGERLRELITINEHAAVSDTVPSDMSSARTDGVLIHPGPAAWEIAATFFHSEQQLVREPHMVSEPYSASESYSCGTYDSPRTCTRSVTRYRTTTEYRNVWKSVEVVDGACEASINHEAQVGRMYLLQFTYQDNDVCSVSCYVQGEAGNERCPVPVSAKK